MDHLPSGAYRHAVTAAFLALGLAAAGCGSSSSSSSSSGAAASTTSSTTSSSPAASSSSTLALTISESGKTAKFSGPATTKGGLVTVALDNSGKSPHSAQLVRILGNHTVPQALMAVGGNNRKTPTWLHAEGGVGSVAPGSTVGATVDLPGGKYAIADLGAQSGPPAFTSLTVTPGASAPVPVSGVTVTAATAGKDRYRWSLSGDLKAGGNAVTFVSKGSDALHLLAAFRVIGKHSDAQLVKALESNGAPPSYVDQSSATQTAVLDGGKSLTTTVTFTKPGTYVLFCPLHDRDGGKSHFAEGLIKTITVK